MSKLKIIVIFIILSNDYQLNLVASSSGEHLFIDIVFEYIGIYYNRIFLFHQYLVISTAV